MGFEAISPYRTRCNEQITIRVVPPQSNGRAKQSKRARVNFSIPRSLCDQMNWQGGDRMAILWGTGADHGTVIIRKAQEGDRHTLALCTKNGDRDGHYSRFLQTSSMPEDARDTEMPALKCEHVNVNKGVLVTLPKRFFYASTVHYEDDPRACKPDNRSLRRRVNGWGNSSAVEAMDGF